MDGFVRKILAGCLALGATAGLCWGQEQQTPANDVQALRQLIEQQQKQIDALTKRLNVAPATPAALGVPAASDPATGGTPAAGDPIPPGAVDVKTVQSIIADYLRDNPGSGMPPGVQSGYSLGTGFYIKSPPNPAYSNWGDQMGGLPWEMRFRGRIQTNYDFYKVQDNYNHNTKQYYYTPPTGNPLAVAPGVPVNPPGVTQGAQVGDFSALEVKRLRLIWEGNVLTPNLTYEFQLDAQTRGFGSFANNRVFQAAGASTPASAGFGAPGTAGAVSPIAGQIQTDHAARLFTAWVAYQIPFGSRSSSSVPIPDGSYSYTPSLTFIVGKQQPYFSLIEIFGSANSQFAEFHMADWFFDTDANNMMMAVSAQYRDFDDRLMAIAQLANGADFGIPAVQLQRTPEFIGCFWWDFGGEFDHTAKRWNLFGNSISDLAYSRKLTVRVGADLNLVHLDPRSQYGDIPSSFYFTAPGAPGGTRLINQFSGGTLGGTQGMNTANIFTYGAFLAAHYRGWSFYNEWYFRTYSSLHTSNPFSDNIVYSDNTLPGVAGNATNNALLPRNNFMDYGAAVQSGYFVVPKKFELIGLYSMVNGQSGDLYGNGTFRTTTIPTLPPANAGGIPPGVPPAMAPVKIYNGAFSNFHMAQEIGVGFNYYWLGQLVKWTTDFSYYRGGNPAGNGQAPAGFIPGVDGWLFRSQLQLAF